MDFLAHSLTYAVFPWCDQLVFFEYLYKISAVVKTAPISDFRDGKGGVEQHKAGSFHTVCVEVFHRSLMKKIPKKHGKMAG